LRKHNKVYKSTKQPWASAAGGRGAAVPLDFQTWYKYSR